MGEKTKDKSGKELKKGEQKEKEKLIDRRRRMKWEEKDGKEGRERKEERLLTEIIRVKLTPCDCVFSNIKKKEKKRKKKLRW